MGALGLNANIISTANHHSMYVGMHVLVESNKRRKHHHRNKHSSLKRRKRKKQDPSEDSSNDSKTEIKESELEETKHDVALCSDVNILS